MLRTLFLLTIVLLSCHNLGGISLKHEARDIYFSFMLFFARQFVNLPGAKFFRRFEFMQTQIVCYQ